QRISVRTENICAAISDHDYALRFLFSAFDSLNFVQRRGRMRIGQSERAGFHPSKCLLKKLFNLCCLHITKDENDSVFCDNIAISKFEQIFPSQPLDRIDRTSCPQRVRMLREKRLP